MKKTAVSIENRFRMEFNHKGKPVDLFVSVFNNFEAKISFLVDINYVHTCVLTTNEKKAIRKILEKHFKVTLENERNT